MMVTAWIKWSRKWRRLPALSCNKCENKIWLNGTQLLLLRASMLEAWRLRVLYGGYYKYYIHNDTPSSKSQNDFCSFGPMIWLLTQRFKLLSFFKHLLWLFIIWSVQFFLLIGCSQPKALNFLGVPLCSYFSTFYCITQLLYCIVLIYD